MDICRDYGFASGSGERVHLLCVLKGGHQFFTDLANALKRLTERGCTAPPLTFDFLRVQSYVGTESNGEATVETLGVDLSQLSGRHL